MNIISTIYRWYHLGTKPRLLLGRTASSQFHSLQRKNCVKVLLTGKKKGHIDIKSYFGQLFVFACIIFEERGPFSKQVLSTFVLRQEAMTNCLMCMFNLYSHLLVVGNICFFGTLKQCSISVMFCEMLIVSFKSGRTRLTETLSKGTEGAPSMWSWIGFLA